MAGGQNLGGIFVSIGLDLRNLQSGVVAAAKALKGLEDVSKGISLSGPDASQYKEVQNTLNNTARVFKEVVGVVSTFASSIKSSMTYAKAAMSEVNGAVVSLETNYEKLQTGLSTIESTLNSASGWAKWGTAMKQNASSIEFLRNQVARLKTTATEVQSSVTNTAKSGKEMFLVKEGAGQLEILKQIDMEMQNGAGIAQRLALSMREWSSLSKPSPQLLQDIRAQGEALAASDARTKQLTGSYLKLKEAAVLAGSVLRSNLIQPLVDYNTVATKVQGSQVGVDKKGTKAQVAQVTELGEAKKKLLDQTELLRDAAKAEEQDRSTAAGKIGEYNTKVQELYTKRLGTIAVTTELVTIEKQLVEATAADQAVLEKTGISYDVYSNALKRVATITTTSMNQAKAAIAKVRSEFGISIPLPAFDISKPQSGLEILRRAVAYTKEGVASLDAQIAEKPVFVVQTTGLGAIETQGKSLTLALDQVSVAGERVGSTFVNIMGPMDAFFAKLTTAKTGGTLAGVGPIEPPIAGTTVEVIKEAVADQKLLLAEARETDKVTSKLNLLTLVSQSKDAIDLASRLAVIWQGLFKQSGGKDPNFAFLKVWDKLEAVLKKHINTIDMIRNHTGEVTAEMAKDYNALAVDIETAFSGSKKALVSISTMTTQILSGMSQEKIPIANMMPNEAEIEAVLAAPLNQVDNILTDLQIQLQEMAKRTDIFTPEQIQNIQAGITAVSKLKVEWRNTGTALKENNLGEIIRSGAGGTIVTEILNMATAVSTLSGVVSRFGSNLKVMNLKDIFKGIWAGTEQELNKVVTSFRSAADGIGSNWENIKRSTQVAVGKVKGSMKEFTAATLDIPTVGAPGMELFVTTVQDMKALGIEVQKNAAKWRGLNLELQKTKSLDTSTWAKQEIATQEALANTVGLSADKKAAAEAKVRALQDPSKQEALFRQAIINLEQDRDKTAQILQQKYNDHRDYIAKLDYAYKELAFNTARAMTQNIQFKPIQTGLKVGEFEQEAMISNSKSIQDLKYQLESLHAQEILNIQTEKSRSGGLQKLNEIVERAAPLTASQVEEMVRLAMSVDNAKVRFDALETIMNKIAQITSSKIILGDKFNAATEYMKLFEVEAQKVTGILGQLGMGMDASGMKVVNAIAGMNAIIAGINPNIFAMRAAFSNINIVLEQHKQKIGVSKDAYAAMMGSINALDTPLKKILLDFAGLNNIQTPKSLEQMRAKLLELLQQGIGPAEQKLKEFYATASQELAVDAAVQKMKISVTELTSKIELLTLTYKSGVATMEQMIELYALLEKQKLLHNIYTEKEILLMLQLSQHIQVASQNVTQFANVQSRLITEVAPLQAMGQAYEANKLKLDILTQSFDQNIRALASVKAAYEGTMTVSKQYGTVVEILIKDSKDAAASYKLVTDLLLKFKAAATANTQGKIVDLSGTISEAMLLKDLFRDISVSGMEKMGGAGASEWVKLFELAEQKLGVSVNKMLSDLNRLKKEQAIKFAPEIESGKISSEIDQLTNRLMQLENAEKVLGSSQNRVNEIIQVRTRLMELMGARTTEEIAIIQRYAQQAAILGTELQKLAEIETQLAAKAGIPHEALGRSYDAQIAKIDVFKKGLQDEALVLNNMGISLNRVTEAETAYNTTREQNTKNIQQHKNALMDMVQIENTIGKTGTPAAKTQLVDKEEIASVTAQVELLNTKLDQLGLKKVNVNTSDLSRVRTDMERARKDIAQKVKEIQGETQQAFSKFTVDLKIEGLDAKEAQIVQEVTDNLKVLGAEQLVAGHSTEFHNKRVQELNKAFVASKNPIQAAQQFLRDEVALGKQRQAQLDDEISKSNFPVLAKIKQGMETSKLNKNQQLLNRTMEDYTGRMPEQAKLVKELTGYVKEQNIESGRSAGRYKGVTQAIQGFTQDIKNLIQVQIRWYVTQALIFNTFYMLRNAITFYMDLEKQVRRVSSALAHQYNIAAINAKIMSVLTKEMVRTGMAAQDLATILWELVSAGLSQQEAMAGVEHINNLAMGSELELSETTRIAAGLFRIYGEEIAKAGTASDKWRYIVDRLSATLNQSQVDMSSLTAGLSYMVNESDTAGISFELMLSILSVLNNRMLMGSKAGRSASRVLSQLTGNAKELTKSFGIEMNMDKPLELLDILEKMKVVLEQNKVNGQLTAGMFDKLQDVFGQVGKRAAIGLIENLDEVKNTMAGLQSDKFAGFAKKMADIKLDSLSKQVDILSNSFQLLMSQSLSPLSELLRVLIDYLNKFLQLIGISGETMDKTLLQSFSKLTLQASLVYTVLKGIAWVLRKPLGTASVFGMIGLGATFLLSVLNSLLFGIPKVGLALVRLSTTGNTAAQSIQNIVVVSKNLLQKITTYQIIGAAIAVLISLYYLWNKYIRDNNDAVRAANVRLGESINKYTEAKGQYVAIRDLVTEISQRYKDAIPYSEDWYRVRNQIKDQYPDLLKYMEVELALTGDVKNALKEYLDKKKEEIGLKEKARKGDAEANKGAIEANAIAKKIADNQLKMTKDDVKNRGKGVEGSFGSYRWYKEYDALRLLNDGTKDYAETFKELIELHKALPIYPVLLAKSFDTLKTKTSAILDIVSAFEQMRNTSGEVSGNLIKLVGDVQKAYNIDLGSIIQEIKLNPKLAPEAIESIISQLRGAAATATSESLLSSNDLSKVIGRVEGFKNKMNEITVGMKNPTEVLEQFDKEVSTIGDKLPGDLKNLLAISSADLNSIYKEGLKENEQLIGQMENNELKARKKLEIAQQSIEKFLDIIMKAQVGEIQSTILTLDNELVKLKGSIYSHMDEIREKFRGYYAGLTADQKEELLFRLGDASQAFGEFAETEIPFTEKQLQPVLDKITEIAKTTRDKLVGNTKEIIPIMNQYIDALNEAQGQVISIATVLANLGASTGMVSKMWIEENKKYIAEAMSYLPPAAVRMMSKATTAEQMLMVKLLSDTRKAIKDEISGIGTVVPETVKEEIALRHYTEMYEKVTLSAKTSYEEQIKSSDEFSTRMIKNLEAIGRTYSDVTNDNIDILNKKRVIEEKYAKDSLAIEKQKETAKVLAFTPQEYDVYTKATADVKKYKDDLQEIDATLFRTAKTQEILNNMTGEFKTVLMGTKASDAFAGMLQTHMKEVQTFIGSESELINESFENLLNNIEIDQRQYVQQLMSAIMKFKGFEDPAKAAEILKTLLQTLVDTKQLNYKLGLQAGMSELDKLSSEIVNKRVDIALDLANAEISQDKILGVINELRLKNEKEYQQALFHEKELRLQKELDLAAIEEATIEKTYNRQKTLAQRKIDDIERVMKTYNATITFNKFEGYLKERIKAQMELFKTEKEHLEKQVALYKREADNFIPVINELKSRLKELSNPSAEPEFNVAEQMRLDTITVVNQALVKNFIETQNRISDIQKGRIQDERELGDKLAEDEQRRYIELVKNREESGAKLLELEIKYLTEKKLVGGKFVIAGEAARLAAVKKESDKELAIWITMDTLIKDLRRGQSTDTEINFDPTIVELGTLNERLINYSTLLTALETEQGLIVTRAVENAKTGVAETLKTTEEKLRGVLVLIKALGEEMVLLPGQQISIYTQMAENAAKDAIDTIQTKLDQKELIFSARFAAGDLKVGGIADKIENELKPEYEKLKKFTQDEYLKALKTPEYPQEEVDKAKSNMNMIFETMFSDVSLGDSEKLRTFYKSLTTSMLGDISKTGKRIEDLGGKVMVGQGEEESKAQQGRAEKLKNIEKAKIPILQEYLRFLRLIQEKAEQLLPTQSAALKLAEADLQTKEDALKAIQDGGGSEEQISSANEEYNKSLTETTRLATLVRNIIASWGWAAGETDQTITDIDIATRNTATDWKKMGFGIADAWKSFKDGAQNAEAIMNDLTNVVLEGFSTAMSDTMTAIFQPPAQEIEDAKAELDDLYKQKEDIAKKMELIKVGGVGADEVEEYNNLEEQLKDVNEQLRIAKGNLDDLKSTAKRVGEAFRQFGKTILDALQQIIAKMLVMWMIESAMSGLSSIFGPSIPADMPIRAAKGTIFKGGFKPVKKFEKGGIAEGGFTSLDKTQKASWTPFLQNMMKAKFLQSGGVTRGPMLGVIGEGSRNEAVVPLPDNKSIPVSFTNDKKMQAPSQDVKIVNLIDPKMVPSIMLQYPEAILNVISEDVLKRGPIYQLLRKV